MTVLQTVLVFVGIPALIVLLIFLATYGRSLLAQSSRYRPGRTWDYPSTWYVPHPEVVGGDRPNSGSTTATGGASGEW